MATTTISSGGEYKSTLVGVKQSPRQVVKLNRNTATSSSILVSSRDRNKTPSQNRLLQHHQSLRRENQKKMLNTTHRAAQQSSAASPSSTSSTTSVTPTDLRAFEFYSNNRLEIKQQAVNSSPHKSLFSSGILSSPKSKYVKSGSSGGNSPTRDKSNWSRFKSR